MMQLANKQIRGDVDIVGVLFLSILADITCKDDGVIRAQGYKKPSKTRI
jgi:hypothetical protein